MFDVGSEYRLPASLGERLVYAGYIAPGRPQGHSNADGAHSEDPYLLATAGGGGDGVAVLAAAMEAGAALGMATTVVAGPLVDEGAFGALHADAEKVPGVELVKFHPRLHSAMAGATAVVTMGGYNSLCEAISAGVPTVVVPRSAPRLEQTIRARIFAERGLVSTVPAGPDLGARVARAVHAATSPRTRRPIDLGGLDRLRSLLLGSERTGGATAPVEQQGPVPEQVAERLPA